MLCEGILRIYAIQRKLVTEGHLCRTPLEQGLHSSLHYRDERMADSRRQWEGDIELLFTGYRLLLSHRMKRVADMDAGDGWTKPPLHFTSLIIVAKHN